METMTSHHLSSTNLSEVQNRSLGLRPEHGISIQTTALPVPNLPHLTIYIQLQRLETSNLIFLTSQSGGGDGLFDSGGLGGGVGGDVGGAGPSGGSSALGSFVYAMPNRLSTSSAASSATEPLCTPLCATPSTVEFATRIAKALARRTCKPTYVGCSVVLDIVGIVDVEAEMAALKMSIDGVLELLKEADGESNGAEVGKRIGVNGVSG